VTAFLFLTGEGIMSKEQMDNFEDWWELEGSRMKVEPGENLYDSELPYRVAKAVWMELSDKKDSKETAQ